MSMLADSGLETDAMPPAACRALFAGLYFACWDTQAPARRFSVQALRNARSSR
jgi:hypothetical protein